MLPGRRDAFVIAPLNAHRRRPVFLMSKFFGQLRILQHALQNPRHPFVVSRERRIVSYPGY
jgi:hypothetical protein